MKKHFSEEQIICLLRKAKAGVAVKELCRRHSLSEASCHLWRSKFGEMSVPDAKGLKDLEAERTRLKKLLAEQVFESDLIKDALRTKWQVHRRSERWRVIGMAATESTRAAVMRMSASALRRMPAKDRNVSCASVSWSWHSGISATAWGCAFSCSAKRENW